MKTVNSNLKRNKVLSSLFLEIKVTMIFIYHISSNKHRASNKHRPLTSAAPLGVHIEISAFL